VAKSLYRILLAKNNKLCFSGANESASRNAYKCLQLFVALPLKNTHTQTLQRERWSYCEHYTKRVCVSLPALDLVFNSKF
jgi:hypothetical protein